MLRGVGRRYGLRGPWVLRGLDLDLPAHTLVRIEGANGVGKSTLLRLLMRHRRADRGAHDGPAAHGVRPRTLPRRAAVHRGRIPHPHGARPRAPGSRGRRTRPGVAGALRGRRIRPYTPRRALQGHQPEGRRRPGAPRRAGPPRPGRGLDRAGHRGPRRTGPGRRGAAAGATVVFVDHDPGRLAGAVGLAYRLEDRTLTPVAGLAR